MSRIQKNLIILSGRWPGWAKSLEKLTPSQDFQWKETPSGKPSGVYRGVTLHSPYDPEKEAQRALTAMEAPLSVVLEGFGLGYQAQALRAAFPQTPLLVVEPDPGLFRWALELRDLEDLLSDPQVYWMVGAPPQSVTSHLDLLGTFPGKLVPLRPQVQTDPGYFRSLEDEIHAFYQMKEVNRNTRKKFMDRWSSNFLKNWPLLSGLRPLGELEGRLAGRPGVVAAAGPSLEGCFDQLKRHRHRIVLVAVDTAYRRLAEEGLFPDILVSTDAQYWNSRHLDSIRPPLPLFVGEMTTPPVLWRGRESRGLLAESAVPLFRDLGRMWGRPLGHLPSGGSVATTAWSASRLLGLDPLVFCGLDLAYPREEPHIRGSTFEEISHSSSHRLRPAQTALSSLGDPAGSLTRSDWEGRPVRTDVRMDLYRKWFEARITLEGGRGPWILRPQGQRIHGFTYLEDLETLLPRTPASRDSSTAVGDLLGSLLEGIPPLGVPAAAGDYRKALALPSGEGKLFEQGWKACLADFGTDADQEWQKETSRLLRDWTAE